MSRGRFGAVCLLDLKHNVRRPLFWIWILIMGLTVWGLSGGSVRIQSGDSTVGGQKAFLTSEFANAQLLSMLVLIFYSFFIAVAAGMAIIRDQELKIGEVLHATPLRPKEYVWGKFAACLVSFLAVLAVHVGASMFFNHATTDAATDDFVGPFALGAYLKPVLVFALPTILFLAGTSFLIGEWTRKPILVFVVPVALFIGCGFFLWNWSPSWLDPRANRALMLVDPSGFRWLNETWLKVDRGVDFYNTQPVGMDAGFVLSRLAFSAFGILSVALSARHFTRTLRRAGSKRSLLARAFTRRTKPRASSAPVPIASLRMSSRRPGFLRGLIEVARVEFRELRSQPGLYIFVPIIIIQVVGNSVFAVGAFDTPLLNTPGTMAVRSLGVMTTLTCLLMMFYVVESLRREEGTRLASIYYATPVRSTSVIFGKALANSFVALAMLGAALAAMVVVLRIQGDVAFDFRPFAITWGLLLLPTLIFWSTFVSVVYALTRSRYTAYGVGLAALVYTGYQLTVGEMTWIGNWPLWGTLAWSDLGLFEFNRTPLIYNRVMVLGAAVLFTVFAVKVFPRRGFDPTRVLLRLRPRALMIAGAKLLPFAAVPLVMAGMLNSGIDAGFQGEGTKERAKDYWRKNIATWKDVKQLDLAEVEIDLEIDPETSWLRVAGTYVLENLHDEPIEQFALTGGLHWRDVTWRNEGDLIEPEDREGLFVFEPAEPLNTNELISIEFSFEGNFPDGMTENGGGRAEFILPSGIVMTSFSPAFAPVIGFRESRGVDEDNSYESRVYPDDFYEGLTRSAFGLSQAYSVRMRITAPQEYTLNTVGTLVSEEVTDGKKTAVWETDQPVRFFNVVGGKWDVRRGEGTAIFYHPGHAYNLDEMIEALDAARKYYSEWFYPYPWSELKLSEFPAHANYAQGFPTNITFSEAIGFLTKSDPRSNAAFMVTAHEAAHQWWGNILNPGDGPGGNILSEGMAHFSTVLLHEQVKGVRERIEFCRRMEDRYNDSRSIDSERPLVEIDGSRAGDNTVQYDKGGWVFWMLLNHIGREHALAGLQSFIAHYAVDRDHAVLQDFTRHLRDFAPDVESYDRFVADWFHDVVLPEYKVTNATVEHANGGWLVRAHIDNVGTASMPIEIAASAGVRFPDEEDPQEEDAEGEDAVLAAETDEDAAAEPYRDARVKIVLAGGVSRDIVIECDFEPERIVVDPDAFVLQRGRERAQVDVFAW